MSCVWGREGAGPRGGLSAADGRDRVASGDGPAELDSAIEPGAVEQRGIDRPCQQLLEVLARKVQPSTAQHRLADLEALADEMIKRHPNRREIAAMFCGPTLNLPPPHRPTPPRASAPP